MSRFYKILAFLVLVCSFWSFPFLSSGQDIGNKNPFGFFKSSAPEEPSPLPETVKKPKELINTFIQSNNSTKSVTKNILESDSNIGVSPIAEKKTMVEVPETLSKKGIDAADFNDPFYRVRGFQEDSEKILQPGTTIDGVRFQTYGDSDKFIERFYRESGFSINKIFSKIKHLEKRGGCYTCHQGIEEISSNHKMSCVRCHGGNRRAKSLPRAHKGLVANPSSMENAPRFCGKCHESHVNKISRSMMATAKGMINITRFGWGAQPADEMPYSLYPTKQEQPYPPSGEGHEVDEFLKTKCLRCHLDTPGLHRPGDYRATGCSACHMVYTNDGLSLSHDRAIQALQEKGTTQNRFERKFAHKPLSNRRGYPVLHKFTTAIPSVQCEHCHQNNGVGGEFEGLFAKPARPLSVQKSINDKKPVLHGKEHKFLVPDIHREKGMHCIDCHIGDEIKPKVEPEGLHSAIQIRCIDCHGTRSKAPEGLKLIESDPRTKQLLKKANLNSNLKSKIRIGDTVLMNSGSSPMAHVKQDKNQWTLISKVTGKKHTIPLLKTLSPSIAHQIPKHMDKIECSACHARWSAAEWGMHLIRENTFNPRKWENWNMTDPNMQELFSENQSEPQGMINWLSAKSFPGKIEGDRLPGFWWSLFTNTGWRDMILGINNRGKYSILKPRYQYFITDQTSSMRLPKKSAEPPLTLDGRAGLIWTTYSPHTIRKTVRSCESCHQNELSIGLGNPLRQNIKKADTFFDGLRFKNQVLPQFQLKQVVTQNGEPLQTGFPGDKIRFLNKEEISALQETTDRYRSLRFLNLRELGFPRLLSRNEFPYDAKHLEKENKMGSPPLKSDLFYNTKTNQFEKVKPKIPAVDIPSNEGEPVISELETREPLQQEKVIEFLYDLFQDNETLYEGGYEPPLEPSAP